MGQTGAPVLKAVFALEALVHSEHPLYDEEQGGIELYTGMLLHDTGMLWHQKYDHLTHDKWTGTRVWHEKLLLFSSAHVEYIRYWLHAMKLTEKPISIPSSNDMVFREEVMNFTPTVFSTKESLQKYKRVSTAVAMSHASH